MVQRLREDGTRQLLFAAIIVELKKAGFYFIWACRTGKKLAP